VKCFVIIQGIENSLMDTMLRNYDVSDSGFLNRDEKELALDRLRSDLEDESWSLSDIENQDLIDYLDFGQLCQLQNRHIKTLKNAFPEHVKAATQLLEKKRIINVRNRVMHTTRPLETADFDTLMGVARELPIAAPSLNWHCLAENIALLTDEFTLAGIAIPEYLSEQDSVPHNLPIPEFDDTGFIGRTNERKSLKKSLESHYPVVTVVGDAGTGKTALALRVCNDVLDDS
jgi:LuxR family transcriptional regulator, glucitol operon activator